MELAEIGLGGVECIDVAQGRDQWRALVYSVVTVLVP
jgi:hypothetical protein